ncbi:MAG TPA: sugar phosphate isomerase/epimerase, partial [Chloroflexota bacterium]|nr:sugar phosphate isomerase/epimerase [Chloroflexota bacterium]
MIHLEHKPGIALQMYTVRALANVDFIGTVRKVRRIGYAAVELAGYGNLSASSLHLLLDHLGVRAIAAHVGLVRLENALEEEVAFNLTLGNRELVCPSIPSERRQDEAGFREIAATLNGIGRRCRDLGARLSYHNHAFEFAHFGDRTGMEILLDETDPDLVGWEPDVYWIAHVQEDPATWIRRYAARCRLVHLKDMTAGPNPTFAEVGEGTLDFAPIFEAASSAEWYIVEQDACSR